MNVRLSDHGTPQGERERPLPVTAVAVTPAGIDPAWMTAALRNGGLIGESAVQRYPLPRSATA